MRLTTKADSIALDRPVNAIPAGSLELHWEWSAIKLPQGGDVRNPATDDEAVQVGVYFDDNPAPIGQLVVPKGRTIMYVWDAKAPVGAMIGLASFGYSYKAIVVRSGASRGWFAEKRNLAEDYAACYGGAPPPIQAIRVQTNSQHTNSASEGLIRRIRLVNPSRSRDQESTTADESPSPKKPVERKRTESPPQATPPKATPDKANPDSTEKPGEPAVAHMLIDQAQALLRGGQKEEARRLLRQVMEKYPGTSSAGRARDILLETYK